MPELLKCKICGYETARCGMTNHIKAQHRAYYDSNQGHIETLVESLGHLSKAEWQQKKKTRG